LPSKFSSRRLPILTHVHSPTGDFLITHHPTYKSLFLATGGSGHGFKFFPVIGDKIVAAMEDTLEPELKDKWRWRSLDELKDVVRQANDGKEEFISCEDGTRAGRKGMILREEMARASLNGVKQ
jgi:sarcosine oxidase / L-pipecolate oxidase